MNTEATASTQAAGGIAGLDRGILKLGAVVVVGSSMAILDATIVNVAIPTLGHELHTSISAIQWVMTGYLLAFASVIPLTGWLTGRFGARRVWITALLAFMAGSVLAGSAWSIGSLIAFRVLQGLGGGLLMPVGQAILARAAGRERMGRVMSVVGVPMFLAPVFGPVIGGAIIDSASWRWIFFLNLPVGLLAVALALRFLPPGEAGRGGRLDAIGLALLSPGLALFIWGLSQAGGTDGIGNPRTIGGITAGVILIAAFVWHAGRLGAAALIDVGLFRIRGFAAAAATNLLLGIALFGALILLPLYLQLVRGQTPLETGLLLMPQGAGAAIALPVAGWLSDKLGPRLVVSAGALIALAGTSVYTQIAAGTSFAVLCAALFVIGLGLGSTIAPSMAAAYRSVPQQAVGHATSTINVIQRVAGSLGTALLAIVLQLRIAHNVPNLHGGLATLARLPDAERAAAAPGLADAFATSFGVAFVLVAAGLVAALFLPGRPAATDDQAR
ncbi:MAG TPA: DHA2 family efflux MFS transporter permease subunit [Gaiellales bacterium]|jgi:EmrB/QacA subfamily drug resistance transporter|nr:DHA2 family efflux MFS transporter permease subunit [Gaiellales bacterium]